MEYIESVKSFKGDPKKKNHPIYKLWILITRFIIIIIILLLS